MGKQENCGAVLEEEEEGTQLRRSPEPAEEAPSAALLLPPTVARRAGYQEVVHRESPALGPATGCPVARLASCLAEWLVVLQRVAEDRGPQPASVSCRCHKASRLCDELQSLGRRLAEACQVAERVGPLPPGMAEGLGADIGRLAHTLRSEVSILIPSGVGRADPEVTEAARWLVCEGDLPSALPGAVEGLTGIVSSLLGVDECDHHDPPMEQDIDEDIRSLVASMCGGGLGGAGAAGGGRPAGHREVGRQVLEKSRKRKQARPTRSPGPLASAWGSGPSLGSPVKRVKRVVTALGTSYSLPSDPGPRGDHTQEGEVLSLLEKKKKLVKKDGLYKFVLWREALKDEKTKQS